MNGTDKLGNGMGQTIPSRPGGMVLQVKLPNRRERPSVIASSAMSHRSRVDYQPGEWVQDLINNVSDAGHKTHHIFAELDILKKYNDAWEWRERSRWVKYEEDVEEGGDRWSRPHVASLSMHSLFDLRKLLLDGAVILDVDLYTLPEIVEHCLDEWISNGVLEQGLRAYVRDAALLIHKHKHVSRKDHVKGLRSVRTMAEIKEDGDGSTANLPRSASTSSIENSFVTSPSNVDLQSLGSDYNLHKPNLHFMKKIPKDAEVAHLMVSAMEHLNHKLIAFLRLKEPRDIGDISEVSYPSRFVFFALGPNKDEFSESELVETGRCMGTLLVDEVFREVAYKAKKQEDLVAGVDEFMEQVTVLPPGEWDPKIRIEPPTNVPSQDFRKMSFVNQQHLSQLISKINKPSIEESHVDPTLVMSKIPLKGLYEDIKRKIPHYGSDFKDSMHIQCLAAFVYVFLGTLTPNVTFGGLLGEATDGYMGVMECIFAAAVTGVIFALFSGQPLNILGSTGPMLVLETIIYKFCKDNDWDFMPARVWVGLWTTLFILLIVIFNLSALVKYITRFTEDSFACLIALIFIIGAFENIIEIGTKVKPVNLDADDGLTKICQCMVPHCNDTTENISHTTIASILQTTSVLSNITSNSTWLNGTTDICESAYNTTMLNLKTKDCHALAGIVVGKGCDFVPDAFFLSILLFIGTFAISYFLVDFKTYSLFPAVARRLISDFAVLIAIIIMVIIDVLLGVDTPKLLVPETFTPTKPELRGWLISPMSDKNPWWIMIAAAIPALLCVILIFLDQQITAVIVNRKEHKLKKGVGYHLDMLVLAVCVAIHSILGLPWYVAATVSALAHINSLKRESGCNAPGEKPSFLGVREQRVTALAIGILSGLTVLITNILKIIPMPVLYGVFLYMGVSALRGMQLMDRLVLFFQPVKYQPDFIYLRHVPLYRVHIFTLVQVVCLASLWAVKSIHSISIVFPLMVLATGVVRKLLEFAYPMDELKWLDELLPGKYANKKMKKSLSDTELLPVTFSPGMPHKEDGNSRISLSIHEEEPEPSQENGKTNLGFFISDEPELKTVNEEIPKNENSKL